MNNGADAADQIVNMSLRGIELLAKITGSGAKNLATYLYAVLKDQKKTKGKTRLAGLLRSGKELKVFAVRNEDLARFTQEAKRYGVLYCALRDKKNLDGLCDIMVRAEDASKINRIVERFKLATVDTASIKSEIQKSREVKQADKEPAEKGKPVRANTDALVNELMSDPNQSKPSAPHSPTNPIQAGTERPSPSAPTSARNGRSAGGAAEPEKLSVRQELRKIQVSRHRSGDKGRNPVELSQTANRSGRPAQPSKIRTKAR